MPRKHRVNSKDTRGLGTANHPPCLKGKLGETNHLVLRADSQEDPSKDPLRASRKQCPTASCSGEMAADRSSTVRRATDDSHAAFKVALG